MVKLGIKCFLIEPAQNFIKLLSRPNTTIKELKTENNLYSKWIQYFIALYNNRTEFLLLANTKMNGYNTIELQILQHSYKYNYENMNNGFKDIDYEKNYKDYNSNSNEPVFISTNEDLSRLELALENYNPKIEYTTFRLVIFIFQYLHTFEDKSINTNLWNYCLKSSSMSYRCMIIGALTLLCQYVWTGTLLYEILNDFNVTDNPSIILISVISTIVSILYGFDTFCSFWNSIPLYKFLIKLYEDYPELELSKNEQKLLYYKKRNINMTKFHIQYNFIADFLSNCILPLIIPFINTLVILNSETVVDSILNCMAIFFIIQIDEELYTVTEYESDNKAITFTRWIISVIYCKHFPEYEKIFKLESDTWHNKFKKISKKIKTKTKTKPKTKLLNKNTQNKNTQNKNPKINHNSIIPERNFNNSTIESSDTSEFNGFSGFQNPHNIDNIVINME
tara:strand:+ start:461 stop:1813 length:1353 start_codon:yes stop_codon:yes gene_type:complete